MWPGTGSRWFLDVSREGDCPASLGRCSLTHTVKELFLVSRQSFLRCSSCPLPLVLLLGTSEKSLAPRSCCPPFRNSYMLIRSLPNLLFSGLS